MANSILPQGLKDWYLWCGHLFSEESCQSKWRKGIGIWEMGVRHWKRIAKRNANCKQTKQRNPAFSCHDQLERVPPKKSSVSGIFFYEKWWTFTWIHMRKAVHSTLIGNRKSTLPVSSTTLFYCQLYFALILYIYFIVLLITSSIIANIWSFFHIPEEWATITVSINLLWPMSVS